MTRLSEEARTTRKMEEKFLAELSAQTSLADLYKSQFDEQTHKVGNLNKVIKELQSMLRESARKQEDLIRDQNRNMIHQLENMGKRVSEVTSNILYVSVNEDSSSKSRLTSNIRYQQDKDILSGKLKVSQAETARIKSQLDNIKHENNYIRKKNEEKTKTAIDSQERLRKVTTDNVLLKKKLDDQSKSHSVEMAKLKKEINVNKAEQKALEESRIAKDAEIKKLGENLAKLKKVGTTYRSKFQEEEAKTKELTAKKEKLNEDFSNRIAYLEVETKEVKKEKDKLVRKYAEKEARVKVVLSNAKEKVTTVENENKKLKAQMEAFSPIISGSGLRPTIQPTLKRTRDSTPADAEMISRNNDEKEGNRASGQPKKQKSEGQ